VDIDRRPKTNPGFSVGAEATGMNDVSFNAVGKDGVRVGF
jgi:hypothetical protein